MTNTRTLVSADSPVWADANSTTIRLNVVFEELPQYGALPFLASPNDVEPWGPAILARAKSGEFGTVGAYVPPAKK